MKNIKNWSVSVIGAMLFVAVSFGLNISSYAVPLGSNEGPVRVYIYAVLMPYLGSNNYTATASNLVQWVYNHPGVEPPGELGYQLDTSYIAQPAGNYTSNTLWFMVDVVSKDPAYKFLPGCLSFAEVEPQDGRLNKTDTTLGNTAWWYASSSQGVIWGPGAGNTIATGYWYQTPVNRFIYVGDASKFFTFDGTYTYSKLDDYIMGYSEDYQVTGTWTFNDTSKPLVHASKTLHTHPIQSDLNGWLTINSIAPELRSHQSDNRCQQHVHVAVVMCTHHENKLE